MSTFAIRRIEVRTRRKRRLSPLRLFAADAMCRKLPFGLCDDLVLCPASLPFDGGLWLHLRRRSAPPLPVQHGHTARQADPQTLQSALSALPCHSTRAQRRFDNLTSPRVRSWQVFCVCSEVCAVLGVCLSIGQHESETWNLATSRTEAGSKAGT